MEQLSDSLDRATPQAVRTICRVLADQGHRAWIVGGCVRDTILRAHQPSARAAGDWDLCTDAEPHVVTAAFKKVIATGIAHGTVTVLLQGHGFEITTLRGEKGHTDGRRPDEVFFVRDLKEDLARRDFTVNAMAYDVLHRKFHDPFDGLSDLHARKLRAVGDAAQRFAEDGLRVLRCARFCATLGFDIEDATRSAIRPSLASFEKVAQERVRDEWCKALMAPAPSRFLRVLASEGLLAITAPPLTGLHQWTNAAQPTLDAVDRAPPDPGLRLALVCVLATEPTQESAAAAGRFMAQRLRLSKQESTRLHTLCRHARLPHELLDAPHPAEARLYLASLGREGFLDVAQLQTLVADSATLPRLETAHRVLQAEVASDHPLTIGELAVSGADLLAAGIPKGPQLGHTLKHLLAAVLKDPSLNEKDRLLALSTRQA